MITHRVYWPVEASDGVIRFCPMLLSNTQTNLIIMIMIAHINDNHDNDDNDYNDGSENEVNNACQTLVTHIISIILGSSVGCLIA